MTLGRRPLSPAQTSLHSCTSRDPQSHRIQEFRRLFAALMRFWGTVHEVKSRELSAGNGWFRWRGDGLTRGVSATWRKQKTPHAGRLVAESDPGDFRGRGTKAGRVKRSSNSRAPWPAASPRLSAAAAGLVDREPGCRPYVDRIAPTSALSVTPTSSCCIEIRAVSAAYPLLLLQGRLPKSSCSDDSDLSDLG